MSEERSKSVNQNEILQILGETGAVIADSHIVYTSGRHGSAYVNKDAVYPHTGKTSRLCQEIAKQFKDDKVAVVIAPAIGGVNLIQWTASHLTELSDGQTEVLAVYAEKEGEEFVLRRGYDQLVRGQRVLVVEDVLTTGGSAKKVITTVRTAGGSIVGLGVICNRGGVTPKDVGEVPKLFSLIDLKLESWAEEDCPLCKRNVPINTDVGKGREFLARKQA